MSYLYRYSSVGCGHCIFFFVISLYFFKIDLKLSRILALELQRNGGHKAEE